MSACSSDPPTAAGEDSSPGGSSTRAGTGGSGSGGKVGSAGNGGTPANGGSGTGGSAGSVMGTGGTGGKGVAGAPGAGGMAGAGATGNVSGAGTGQGGASGGQGGMEGGAAGSGRGGAPAAGGGGRGSAGMSGAGAGGMSTTGKAPPEPSAGCGKASPATGSSGSPLNVSSHQYYVKLPTSYDASKPYPVLFMFNPTNNPLNWAETSAGFESNGAKDGAIRVYPGPLSMANGWGASDVAFFQPLYDQITANFCVDKARVFAAGESSGGDFSSILGCEHADVLRGVAPCATKNVNGYALDATTRKCTGQVASVVIHGKNDKEVGPENGPKTRDFYVALNHCSSMSPMPVSGYTDTLSNCVLYQGCDEGFPVYWCQHTDPEYSNTNHGWPHFAAKFVWELFSSY